MSSGVVVITGGTAGVGRAAVREFAENGYDVAVLARGAAGLKGAAEEILGAGRSTALTIPTDVADAVAVDRAAQQVEDELGPIDVWVNVAFAGSLAYFWDTTDEEYRRMTEVTYLGQVNGTRAALARMRPRDHGVVVNVGSAMAYRSIPLQSAYCGAKHAVKGFTEAVATELAHERSGVKICMVQLPGLNTPQFNWNLTKVPGHPRPVAPVFQPELAARAVRFVAEHPRRSIWVGISTAYTILGERVAPTLVRSYLARTGVTGQQTGADLPRYGPNLFAPGDEDDDRGAHGSFDDQAHFRDPVLWASMHRGALLAGALSGLAGFVGVGAWRRRGR
ncbi:SDR family oxidoreductase [Pseudonocardia halophobica]|uniref:Short-chain dehydrogenase n=1 Tax=Pseudonocardia halophobica TaxID=29401 RepID=A0A9W6NU39_9PSEU|nr:SDR family oxidoreductase [Pseudonocardia halophobica]GLL09374.1 short-chain dehydrogenase [Pseudonocardia halophobica]